MLVALALAGAVSLIGSSAASAQVPDDVLPPEVQEIVDQATAALPPEVQDAVNQAVEDALNALVEADVPNVGQAEASPGHSEASAIHFPDVLTVNRSETNKDSARVQRLSLLGQDLLVKEGDAEGGQNTGELAALGDAIDEINTALCPGGRGTLLAPRTGQCVTVLDANATETCNNATCTSRTNSANSAVLSARTATGGNDGFWQLVGNQGVTVLPNSATTNVTRVPILGDRCTDIATNSLLGGSGTPALLSIVGLKLRISAFAAC